MNKAVKYVSDTMSGFLHDKDDATHQSSSNELSDWLTKCYMEYFRGDEYARQQQQKLQEERFSMILYVAKILLLSFIMFDLIVCIRNERRRRQQHGVPANWPQPQQQQRPHPRQQQPHVQNPPQHQPGQQQQNPQQQQPQQQQPPPPPHQPRPPPQPVWAQWRNMNAARAGFNRAQPPHPQLLSEADWMRENPSKSNDDDDDDYTLDGRYGNDFGLVAQHGFEEYVMRREKLDDWHYYRLQIEVDGTNRGLTVDKDKNNDERDDVVTTTTSNASVGRSLPSLLRYNLKAAALRSRTIYDIANGSSNFLYIANRDQHATVEGGTIINRTDMNKEDERLLHGQYVMVLPLHGYSTQHLHSFFQLLLGKIQLRDIPDDAVVDCCVLAHYLQCTRQPKSRDPHTRATSTDLFQEIIDHCLKFSVDSNNCLSLYHFAGTYGQQPLQDRALSHIVDSFDAMEGRDYWDDLPASVRKDIHKMHLILKGDRQFHGHNKELFFSNCREYIGMLKEHYQYHVERLEEAMVEQVQEASEIGPSYRTSADETGWMYAQCKIERQASKVKALKQFLKDQGNLLKAMESEKHKS